MISELEVQLTNHPKAVPLAQFLADALGAIRTHHSQKGDISMNTQLELTGDPTQAPSQASVIRMCHASLIDRLITAVAVAAASLGMTREQAASFSVWARTVLIKDKNFFEALYDKVQFNPSTLMIEPKSWSVVEKFLTDEAFELLCGPAKLMGLEVAEAWKKQIAAISADERAKEGPSSAPQADDEPSITVPILVPLFPVTATAASFAATMGGPVRTIKLQVTPAKTHRFRTVADHKEGKVSERLIQSHTSYAYRELIDRAVSDFIIALGYVSLETHFPMLSLETRLRKEFAYLSEKLPNPAALQLGKLRDDDVRPIDAAAASEILRERKKREAEQK